MQISFINPYNNKYLEFREDGMIDEEGQHFPKIKGAFRFVDSKNYTDNFGYQWNKFQKTQLDRTFGNFAHSKERFFAQTGWEPEKLKDENILEVGSGAGRFTQVVLSQTDANLYSIDYSSAVEANYRNNGPNPRLNLFQASIYEMPFAPESFDKVFCFGVLQHTPDVKLSVKNLCRMVKPGGELVIDFYPVKGWYTKIHAKYIFRPLTKRLKFTTLLALIERNADRLIKTYQFLEGIKLGFLTRLVPICDIKNTLPASLNSQELREWVILDTFDMLSPAHDHPQPIKRMKQWLEGEGLMVDFANFVHFGGNNKAAVIRARKKQ